jgi:TonB family protein
MSLAADSGPNLLLDWHEAIDSPRWIRAGSASLAVHLLVVPLIIALMNLETPAPRRATEIVSNLQRVTLIAPPSELTQKAPNRAKIAKEVNVEDLMPRPASQERLPPTPAVRTFRPPVPKNPGPPEPGPSNIAEPPKIDAALNPPQVLPAPSGTPKAPPPNIDPVEQPKLAFQTPGQRGTSPETTAGQSKLAPPKATVEAAIQSVTKGGGQGGIVVGDIDQPLNIPQSPQMPPSPGRSGSSLELMSDPMGVDFKPYLIQILALVRRNWFAVIPESARLGNRGLVQLQFIIDRSGQVPKLVIAMPSGVQALDKAAVASISASVPFPPLPPEYKGLSIRLQFAFKYNVQ